MDRGAFKLEIIKIFFQGQPGDSQLIADGPTHRMERQNCKPLPPFRAQFCPPKHTFVALICYKTQHSFQAAEQALTFKTSSQRRLRKQHLIGFRGLVRHRVFRLARRSVCHLFRTEHGSGIRYLQMRSPHPKPVAV